MVLQKVIAAIGEISPENITAENITANGLGDDCNGLCGCTFNLNETDNILI